MTVLETLRRLDSGPRGLTEAEAEERLGRYGENTVAGQQPLTWPRRLLRSMRDPFTTVLLCLGVVSALVASWGTACVIGALVVVSCVLRSAGEYRADRSMAALRELVATTVTVQRRASPREAPRSREIPVDQLVPGDVIRLGPGDMVPADVRLLRAGGLTVHQAALTGESVPVAKHPLDAPPPAVSDAPRPSASGTPRPATAEAPSVSNAPNPAAAEAPRPAASKTPSASDIPNPSAAEAPSPHPPPLPTDTSLFDQPHLCFQGSSVASGSASAVVIATGPDTRFSGTYRRVGRQGRDTAFDRSMNGVAWILIRFMLLTPPLVLMAGAAVRGRGLETLPFGVAVAVGLTPEMLPVIVTIALARGAALLARGHEVIVKRLPALHDLGAIDVLCVDKTGTLTQDLPVVACSLDADGREDPQVLHWAAVNSWWTLHLVDLPTPDALDEAILDAVEKQDGTRQDGERQDGTRQGDDQQDAAQQDPDQQDANQQDADQPGTAYDRIAAYEGIAALPFDPVRRSSCAVVRDPEHAGGPHTLVVKGAVDDVLKRCVRMRTGGGEVELDAAARELLRHRAAERAADGLRLLAVALAERPARLGSYTASDERELTFLGFVGLRDAPAPTAAEALDGLARRGIAVKVLTGDHPGTAARVCRDLGLDPGTVVTADRIDALGDAELTELAARTTVFARCAPEHKARIVGALRAGGHTTGYLGDGVNDLPALHASDVSMCPRYAVDVTRETADVVLAAKDLTAIDRAVVTGRRSTANITGYLRVTLSSNFGNVIAMLAAGLMLSFLPMLPVQVLVQNLCFDAAQLALAFDRPPRDAARRPVLLRPGGLLRFLTLFGLLNAAADLATFAVLTLTTRGTGPEEEQVFHAGWFTENLLTQALVMLLLRTGRRRAEGRTPGPIRLATCALAIVGVLLPLSPVAPVLGMTGLPPTYYGLLAAVLTLYGAALAIVRNRYDRRHASGTAVAS
ncbi:HAD-IC family P-type ATPase [Streptomyces sp. NPDC003077]|uniref:HAD-IC family P-type ATPase n=1 Tax=Streptomyces sp. NPDC003077 TaxID=3154443 RepID=UPI0033BA2ABD